MAMCLAAGQSIGKRGGQTTVWRVVAKRALVSGIASYHFLREKVINISANNVWRNTKNRKKCCTFARCGAQRSSLVHCTPQKRSHVAALPLKCGRVVRGGSRHIKKQAFCNALVLTATRTSQSFALSEQVGIKATRVPLWDDNAPTSSWQCHALRAMCRVAARESLTARPQCQ